MSLISEGISDMMYACRAYSNRQFDWTDYAKMKAVSITIAICSVGLSNIFQDVASLVSGEADTLAREATREAGEMAATQFAANAKTVGKEILKTAKNLKSLAFKFTGMKAGEAIVREGLSSGVKHLTNISLDHAKPHISAAIEQRVNLMFCNPRLKCLLRKMYALDYISRSKSLQDKVNKIVADAINPERSFMRRQWDSVGSPLLSGVLGTSEKYGGIISLTFRIVGTLQGLYALQAIISNVHEVVITKLSQIDEDTLTTNLLLEEHVKVEKEKARVISLQLASQRIDVTSIVKLSYLDEPKNEYNNLLVRIGEYRKTDEEVGSFLDTFFDKFTNMDGYFEQTLDLIIKAVADKMTEQILHIIGSQLVSPWSTLATSGITDALFQRIQHYCLVDEKQNTDSLNEDQKRFDTLSEGKENGEKLSDDDKAFMKNFGAYLTVGQQINYNSTAYCLDYQQYAIKHYAEQLTTAEGKPVSREILELADSIRDDKPASMAEMSALSKALNLKLKMTSDEKYKPTTEEIAQGVKVIYIEKGKSDAKGVEQVGHSYFANNDGTKTLVDAKPNDCFYTVCRNILEARDDTKSYTVDQLREITADAIASNSNFAKVLAAEKWIQKRYPIEAKTLLFIAGIKENPNTKRLETEVNSTIDDIEDLDDSVTDPATGKQTSRGTPYDIIIKQKFRENSEYTIQNSDGTTTIVSITINPNGSTTTTNTVRNPDGITKEVYKIDINGATKTIRTEDLNGTLLSTAQVDTTRNSNNGIITTVTKIMNPDGTAAKTVNAIIIPKSCTAKPANSTATPVTIKKIKNSNGTTTTVKTIRNRNGTTTAIAATNNPNGTTTIVDTTKSRSGITTTINTTKYPNGTVTTTTDNTLSIRNQNGTTTIVNTMINPNGTTKTINKTVDCSGKVITRTTVETIRNLNGSTAIVNTTTDPSGTTIVNTPNTQDMHLHHTVPYNQIKDVLVNDKMTKSKPDRQVVYDDFINHPEVRPYVEHLMANRQPGANDGQILHAAMAWYKNNLAAGMDPALRSDDGGSGIDQGLRKPQTSQYNAAIDNFDNNSSIPSLGQIPTIIPPQYKPDPQMIESFEVFL